ncbi:hypothetical protein ACJX0J_036101 [Zea mays]
MRASLDTENVAFYAGKMGGRISMGDRDSCSKRTKSRIDDTLLALKPSQALCIVYSDFITCQIFIGQFNFDHQYTRNLDFCTIECLDTCLMGFFSDNGSLY